MAWLRFVKMASFFAFVRFFFAGRIRAAVDSFGTLGAPTVSPFFPISAPAPFFHDAASAFAPPGFKKYMYIY